MNAIAAINASIPFELKVRETRFKVLAVWAESAGIQPFLRAKTARLGSRASSINGYQPLQIESFILVRGLPTRMLTITLTS